MKTSRNAIPLSSLPPKLREQAEKQLGMQPVITLEAKAPRALQPMKDKRIRQSTKPLMNKLESEFAEYLRVIRSHDTVFAQAVRLRIANGQWFKPDFLAIGRDGRITFYETKGPKAFRGGFENLKCAASLYPIMKFILAWKDNGQWKFQEVLP